MMNNNDRRFLLKRLCGEVLPPLLQLLIVAVLAAIIFMIYNESRGRYRQIESDYQATSIELKQVGQGIVSANRALDLWQIIQNQLQDRNGLDMDSFRTLIETLQLKHAINNLKVNVTDPLIRDDSKSNPYFNIECSQINITFDAFTDVEAYRFIDEIIENTSGLLYFENLEMYTKENIEKRQVVVTSFTLSWHNIIDLRAEVSQ